MIKEMNMNNQVNKDLVGQRFGRWSVMKKAQDSKTGVRYICKCDCGTTRTVLARNLLDGKSKSCGCLKTDLLKQKVKANHPNYVDLTGLRFGKLTAIKDSGKRNPDVLWECRCDCGNLILVSRGNLKSGHQKSCGCFKKSGVPYKGLSAKDIANKRFGRLIALKQTGQSKSDGSLIWECICDCGTTVAVASTNLLTGKTISCGCLREERRLDAIRSDEAKKHYSERSKRLWPKAEKWIGMQDDTNISIITSTKARCDSSSGVRGVREYRDGKFSATLTFQKKTYTQKGFHSLEEAAKARARMYEEIVEPYLDSIRKEQPT